MRWPIVRNVLFAVLLLGGIALAGRKGKDDADPPPVEAAAPVVEAPPAAPAPPPAPAAPALFPSGVPVTLQETPTGLASLSAQACVSCHTQAHGDWQGSAHASAWRSPTFQAAIDKAGSSTACRACHLPLTNQHPRLAAGYLDGDLTRPNLQPNPSWDPTLMSEGVTCAACHVRDGVVVGTHAAPEAPHPVAVSDELGKPEFCATCHQLTWPGADRPFYDTYGEWKASAYAKAGVGCKDCHMPVQAGLATASRFAATPSHAFEADPAQAISVLVSLDAPEVQRGKPYRVGLRLQNTGAGHHFPTGSPFVGYSVEVALLGADGKPLVEPWRTTLARTVAPAPPWGTLEDTRLAAGAEMTVEKAFTVDQKKKAGSGVLRVSLVRSGDAAHPTVLQEIPVGVY